MIDPISALEGLQKSIQMVKKASKVANDLGGLVPMIGKMFDARSMATKAMVEAKRSGKKNNLGVALQIEMALDEAARFEESLKMLFMQAGRIDVWNKAKERRAQMDLEDAQLAKAAKEQERKQKEKDEELQEIALIVAAVSFLLLLIGIGVNELAEFCHITHRCGR